MKRKSIKKDVVIIGAGIVGCAIARELSRFEKKVLVVEKESDVSCGTTKANSGIIHAGYAESPGTLRSSLCHKGNLLFKKNAEELDIPLKNTGSLVSVLNLSEIKVLERLLKNGKDNGLTDLKIIYGSKNIKKIEPNINEKVCASLLAKEASITSPYEAAFALYENAKLNGVEFLLNSAVNKIDFAKHLKHFFLKTPFIEIEAEVLINAAGIFAHNIANMIGDYSFEIHPAKGEYFVFDNDTTGFVNIINFSIPGKSTKGVVATPTVDNNILAGPNFEYTDFRDLSTTFEGLSKIKQKIKDLFPEIPFKKVISSFAGLRAVSSTNDFVIGSSHVNDKFINIGGIQSPGLTCVFSIAQIVIDILRDLKIDLEGNKNFYPIRKKIERFKPDSLLKNFKRFSLDENYNEIICRCENVTKAEIIEAIKRGATNIDGIKLRTRAGMGRCQGGYCLLRVMKIISEELNIPYEEITKKGNNAKIIKTRMN